MATAKPRLSPPLAPLIWKPVAPFRLLVAMSLAKAPSTATFLPNRT
jgi:hypothetical protein